MPANSNSNDKKTDDKDVSLSSKCIASVASVADLHETSIASVSVAEKGAVVEINSPMLPCEWCDYKNVIEFDLGNHILERHRGELLKLPLGKGTMDTRIDYAVQQIKRGMAMA